MPGLSGSVEDAYLSWKFFFLSIPRYSLMTFASFQRIYMEDSCYNSNDVAPLKCVFGCDLSRLLLFISAFLAVAFMFCLIITELDRCVAVPYLFENFYASSFFCRFFSRRMSTIFTRLTAFNCSKLSGLIILVVKALGCISFDLSRVLNSGAWVP